MTSEISNRKMRDRARGRLTYFTVSLVLIFSLYPNIYYAHGQNSTSSDNQDEVDKTGQDSSYPSSQGNSTSANGTGTSEVPSSGSNSTSEGSEQAGSDSEQTENSNSTSTGTNQTSTIPDEGQTSGNATDSSSNTTMNSTKTESYQNSTSEHQGNSTATQSTNSTYSGNTTGTESGNSTSAQIMNENTTITSNANLTDSVAVNQTAASLSPPDFDISIDPLTTIMEAGSSTTYTIIVSSVNGFNADVSLAVTSKPRAGITASLSSNMTRPPTNASSTLSLNVQSDPDTQSGKYKLKVTASSLNMTDSSASVTLEVMGKNLTLDQTEQFDPVALTPVLIKDMQDRIIDDVSAKRMVLISTTVTNNYNQTQPFIVVVEVRDGTDGTTLYLQLQKGVLNPLGEVEVAISWIPEKAGTYQVRTFAINELKEDPEPLSVPVGKLVDVR